MRRLPKNVSSLFRKRGTCEEHCCPRPCYDCMWAAAFFLANGLKQTQSSFNALVQELGKKKKVPKKNPSVLSDAELEIYRRCLHVKQSMVGYNEMMAIARTLLSHIDSEKKAR